MTYMALYIIQIYIFIFINALTQLQVNTYTLMQNIDITIQD